MMKIVAFALFVAGTSPASAADLEALSAKTCEIFNTSTAAIMGFRQSGATHEYLHDTYSSLYAFEREESMGLHILSELLLGAVDSAYEWKLREDASEIEEAKAVFMKNESRLCEANWYRHFLRLNEEGYTF